jgi:hypothetical protein
MSLERSTGTDLDAFGALVVVVERRLSCGRYSGLVPGEKMRSGLTRAERTWEDRMQRIGRMIGVAAVALGVDVATVDCSTSRWTS